MICVYYFLSRTVRDKIFVMKQRTAFTTYINEDLPKKSSNKRVALASTNHVLKTIKANNV